MKKILISLAMAAAAVALLYQWSGSHRPPHADLVAPLQNN
jgi:hypothetical protein